MSFCELPSFYEETFPSARKKHKCVECSAPITPGEKHLSYRAHWPGIGFGTGRQHMLCREACMAIRDDFQSGECIGFGCLKEEWENYAKNYGEPIRDVPEVTKFRGLMAGVLWRERFSREKRQ